MGQATSGGAGSGKMPNSTLEYAGVRSGDREIYCGSGSFSLSYATL